MAVCACAGGSGHWPGQRCSVESRLYPIWDLLSRSRGTPVGGSRPQSRLSCDAAGPSQAAGASPAAPPLPLGGAASPTPRGGRTGDVASRRSSRAQLRSPGRSRCTASAIASRDSAAATETTLRFEPHGRVICLLRRRASPLCSLSTVSRLSRALPLTPLPAWSAPPSRRAGLETADTRPSANAARSRWPRRNTPRSTHVRHQPVGSVGPGAPS